MSLPNATEFNDSLSHGWCRLEAACSGSTIFVLTALCPLASFGLSKRECCMSPRQPGHHGHHRDAMLVNTQVESCWVLQPPRGQVSRSVVLFTGGAFAGAAPQLTYRLLIECLAKRGMTVRIATAGKAWSAGCNSHFTFQVLTNAVPRFSLVSGCSRRMLGVACTSLGAPASRVERQPETTSIGPGNFSILHSDRIGS